MCQKLEKVFIEKLIGLPSEVSVNLQLCKSFSFCSLIVWCNMLHCCIPTYFHESFPASAILQQRYCDLTGLYIVLVRCLMLAIIWFQDTPLPVESKKVKGGGG